MQGKQLTKTEIKKALMTWNENRPFMSVSDISESMHIGRDSARNLVSGLPYIPNGRRKDYLVEDIAERLSERSQY